MLSTRAPRLANCSLIKRGLPWGVLLLSLVLFVATLMPDILPADSGEFQRVAALAGIAHPPGYPLYTMLGWLFTRLPLGATPAWRVNLFSAVTAAVTLALVFSTGRGLSGSAWGGLAAALALGTATTFWATATEASIRPLTAFFTALCLHMVCRVADPTLSARPDGQLTDAGVRGGGPVVVGRQGAGSLRPPRTAGNGKGSADWTLAGFGLALSLGITHHPSLAFSGTVFLIYLLLVDPTLIRRPSRWARPIAALALGLVVLVYLPLRGPLQGAPDLATWPGFLNHVLARGFRGDMFALNLFDRLELLPTLLRFQFNPMLLLGMLTGVVCLLWRNRKLALLLVGSAVIHIAVTLTYDAPQTVEYAVPAYVSLALLVAVPFGLVSSIPTRHQDQRGSDARLRVAAWLGGRFLGAVLLVAGVFSLTVNLPSYRTLSRSLDTREYVEAILREAPADATVLSNWHWFNPLRYLQQVEEKRPDLTVEYVAPLAEPLAQTWVHRIEDHIQQRPVVVTRRFEQAYSTLPYRLQPLEEAFLVRQEARSQVPHDAVPLDVTLGEQIKLLGYALATDEAQPAQPLTMTLTWSPLALSTTDIAVFAQLIGPDGQLWSASVDARHSLDRFSVADVIVDRFVIYPLMHAHPGDYSLVVGVYSPDGRLETTRGSDVVELGQVRLRPSTSRPVTGHPCLSRPSGGPTLIGVDYDIGADDRVRTYLHWMGPGQPTVVNLGGNDHAMQGRGRVPLLGRGEYATIAIDHPGVPSRLTVLGDEAPRRWNLLFGEALVLPPPRAGERYIPFGDAIVLTGFSGPPAELTRAAKVDLHLRFLGQRPLERDYIVSTALTGLNADNTWAWRAAHDTVPAQGAIPTLKWIRGSAVRDRHQIAVPVDAPDVPAVGSVTVYDHFTQRSLPHLDERRASALELGRWSVVEP